MPDLKNGIFNITQIMKRVLRETIRPTIRTGVPQSLLIRDGHEFVFNWLHNSVEEEALIKWLWLVNFWQSQIFISLDTVSQLLMGCLIEGLN